MNANPSYEKRGFINFIILVVVIVIALAFFRVDVRSAADSWGVTGFVVNAWHAIVMFWIAYIQPAFTWALSFLPAVKK